jgi:hypothetical protein
MITKFHLFELNSDEPKIGDYVICQEVSEEPKNVSEFINNNIGQLVKKPKGQFFMGDYEFWVIFQNIPYEIEDVFYDGIRPMLRKEIKFWSENKEEVELFIQARNYNL